MAVRKNLENETKRQKIAAAAGTTVTVKKKPILIGSLLAVLGGASYISLRPNSPSDMLAPSSLSGMENNSTLDHPAMGNLSEMNVVRTAVENAQRVPVETPDIEIPHTVVGKLLDLKATSLRNFRLQLDAAGNDEYLLSAVPQTTNFTDGIAYKVSVSPTITRIGSKHKDTPEDFAKRREWHRMEKVTGLRMSYPSTYQTTGNSFQDSTTEPHIPVTHLKSDDTIILRIEIEPSNTAANQWLSDLSDIPIALTKELDARLNMNDQATRFCVNACTNPNDKTIDTSALETLERTYALDDAGRKALADALIYNDMNRAKSILENMTAAEISEDLYVAFQNMAKHSGLKQAEIELILDHLYLVSMQDPDNRTDLEHTSPEMQAWNALERYLSPQQIKVLEQLSNNQLQTMREAITAGQDAPTVSYADFVKQAKIEPTCELSDRTLECMQQNVTSFFGRTGQDGWVNSTEPGRNVPDTLGVLLAKQKLQEYVVHGTGDSGYKPVLNRWIHQQGSKKYLLLPVDMKNLEAANKWLAKLTRMLQGAHNCETVIGNDQADKGHSLGARIGRFFSVAAAESKEQHIPAPAELLWSLTNTHAIEPAIMNLLRDKEQGETRHIAEGAVSSGIKVTDILMAQHKPSTLGRHTESLMASPMTSSEGIIR